MKKISVILALVIYATAIYANECSDILKYSQTTSHIISNKSDFDREVHNFCKEYSSNKSSKKSLGVKYKVLSFSSGGSSASSMASKYCSDNNKEKSKNNAFESYVTSVNPSAYTAYIQCKQLSKELQYSSKRVARKLTVDIAFNSKVKKSNAVLSHYTTSNDNNVSCKWKDTDEKKITLSQGSSSVLKCKRSKENQGQLSYVAITRDNESGLSIQIPWQAYSKEDIPVDTLNELKNQIEKTEQELNTKTTKLEKIQKSLKNKVAVNTKNISNIGIIDTLEVRGSWSSNIVHTLPKKNFTDYRNIIVCSSIGPGDENCRLIDADFTGYTYLDFNGVREYETRFKIIGNNQYEYSGNVDHNVPARRFKDNRLYLIQGLHKKAL